MTEPPTNSQPIPVTEMRDVRVREVAVPVFDPRRGFTLRRRIITTWRDRQGRLMGSWRWGRLWGDS